MVRLLRCPIALSVAALTACGSDPATPDVPPVVAVSAAGSVSAIASGSTVQLSATYTDRRGRSVGNATFTWSSANSAVAAVTAAGLVTGIQAGTTTISATSSGTTGSVSLTVTPGTPARLVLTTAPAGAASGVRLTTQPVVEVRDNADNLVTSATTTVNVALVGSGTITGTISVPAVQGIARFTDLVVSGLVGGRSLQFFSPGLTPVTSSAFDVVPGPAATLTFVGAPPRLRSGLASPTAVQVQLRDREGNDAPEAGRRVTVTASGGAGVTALTNNTVLTNGQGRAVFSALTVAGLAGPRTLSFVADSISTAATASLSLVGGAPTRLAIERDAPAAGEDGVPLSPPPIVRMLDSVGNTAPDAGISVRAALAGGAGTLTNNTAVSDSLGRATFTGLTIFDGSGARTLQFSASGLTGITSRSIAVAPPDTAPQPASIRTTRSASDTVGRVLELSATSGSVTPFLLTRNAAGTPMGTGGVRWLVRDPSRASVAADGRITGALPGRTFVVAQASRTPSVADSVLVFVPRNATGPILRASLPSYRITTDTFSLVVEIVPRDGSTLSAADLEVAWPGSAAFPFSPFNVTAITALRTGVVAQTVDAQQNVRVTWTSATPVAGPVQLVRLSCRVNQRNVGNQVIFTLNQLLAGDLTDLTGATSVFNPVVIVP
jgi:hypothetical protein